MLENNLLDILLPLVNLEKILSVFFLKLLNAGVYFVGYYLAISDSWGILCW